MTSGLAGVHAPENKQGPLGHPTCLPVVVLKTWPPVGCAQQGLHCAGQVHKHVAHEEKPEGIRYSIGGQAPGPSTPGPLPSTSQEAPSLLATSPSHGQPCPVSIPVSPGRPTQRVGASRPISCRTRGHSHGEDGGHAVQGGDEDAGLADEGCEQQGPRGLPIGLSVAKHLQKKGRELVAAAQGPQEHPAFRGGAYWAGQPGGVSEMRHQQNWVASHVRIASPCPGHPELVGIDEGPGTIRPRASAQSAGRGSLAGGLLAS